MKILELSLKKKKNFTSEMITLRHYYYLGEFDPHSRPSVINYVSY